jgi:phosphatidate cytidylyltransferase
MNNFFTRTLTGALFVIVIVGATLFHHIVFVSLFLLIESLTLWEFYAICRLHKSQPLKYYGLAIGAYLILTSYLTNFIDFGKFLYLLLFPMVVFIFIFELYRNNRHPLINIATTLLGIIYIALPFSLLVPIAFLNGTYQGKLILGLFILMWTIDTGAYIFGKLFGKHKLFERVSPKKTWEGFIGGALVSIGGAFVMCHFIGILAIQHWITIALLMIIFGTLGDLIESMFKRSVGMKDSGKILPGHGGILDRFDSLILAIPIIFAYLQLFVKL